MLKINRKVTYVSLFVHYLIFVTEKPDQSGLVDELKRQLREKDLVLTDIRLEALSSAHQLESLKDTVIKMRVNIFFNYFLNNFQYMFIK